METDLFRDIVVIVVAAFAGGTVARAVRLPPVLGYLGIGIVVGPDVLGLIGDVEAVRTLAELGVVLLLFAVGVEISPSDLGRLGPRILVAGLAQLGLTGAGGYAIGWSLGWSVEQSLLMGMVVSLSSTMVVLKVLNDRGEVRALQGRVMTGMLVIQDLAFVPMIAVVSDLGSGSLAVGVGLGALKAAAVLAIVFVVGGRAIPWLLRHVALLGSRESFIITVLAISVGAAAATQAVGLSAALGAFAAGLVISASDWSGHRALQEVTPLRDIFAAMFFASLGMLMDLEFLLDNAWTVVFVVAASAALKFVVVSGTVRVVGYLPRTSMLAGAGMVQIGEFSFILAETAELRHVVDADFLSLVVVATIVTMGLTPASFAIGAKGAAWLGRVFPTLGRQPAGAHAGEPAELIPRLEDHVVVAGLGRVGTFIAEELRQLGIPFVGIDTDPAAVARTRRLYGLALHGDSASETFLTLARVQSARLLVVGISEPISALVTVQHARRLNPALHIVGRVGWQEEADALKNAGADAVIWPEMEAALEIMRVSLIDVGMSPRRVSEVVSEARHSLNFGGPGEEQDSLA